MKAKKIILSILGILGAIILFCVLVLGGYVVYLCCQYYRIEDNQEVSVTNNQSNLLSIAQEYTISSYNIGFGAYEHDFSFFMDSGEFKDGTKVTGTGSRAKSKEVVQTNTNGAISTIQSINPDFALFQEVDTASDRSYFVNQYEALQDAFEGYASIHTVNFHSGFLCYPITSPHGAVNSGIATLSKYKIDSVVRRSFPIDESFPTKFFDLDRCFSVNKLSINGTDKKLVLINLHMSAYDEGGVYRAKQLELFLDYMSQEYENGNYVIAGGDWNHDIADSLNYFETDMNIPEWVFQIKSDELPQHFSFASSKNTATCRSTDIPYTLNENNKMANYSVVLDGFVVSDNVLVTLVQNIDTNFEYSDHNPATMKFMLI